MDWFSWLSKTALEPSLVYEYGLTLAHNELEEEDILYFNHEFLQSMGISIAKHRLEILKLAKKDKGKSPHAVSKLIVAIKKTKKSLANYVKTLVHHEESALVVVPPRPNNGFGTRWKSCMMKRTNKLMVARQEKLFLTSGNQTVATVVPSQPVLDGFSSPVVYHFQKEEKVDANDGDDDDDGYWSAAVEEIKWDTMFQDLKPN